VHNRYLVELDVEALLDAASKVDASHRTTPNGGSGPASTIGYNSCSADSFGRRPEALPLISPSGPL
jgi:hypothetical protein